jgi:creatinine amidohydrolase
VTSAQFARDLTWPQLKRLADAGAVALLPVGSTEAHGPHLPLSTDVVIAEAVAQRVAAKLEAKGSQSVIFPASSYSLTDFAGGFAGTVSIGADAARAFLTEVLVGISRAPFRRVGVLNHHLEPLHFKLVHEAARQASARAPQCQFIVADHRRPPFSDQLGREFTHGGSHAGWYETSLVMAAAPHLVVEAERQKLPELAVDLPALIRAGKKDFLECGGSNAYFGNPQSATAEEGARLLDLLATHAADLLSEA